MNRVNWINIAKLLCIAYFLFLSACATKSSLRHRELAPPTYKGNYQEAIKKVHKNDGLYGKKEQFLYHMDLGVLHHYAKAYDSSNKHLEQCVRIYDDLYTKSATKQLASTVVNDNVLNYRGKLYEIVAVHQLMAFNYLAQKQTDEALVESRRAQLLFDEWKKRNPKKYHNDGMFHYLSALTYQLAGEKDNSLISLFKSVKAYQNSTVPLPKEVRKAAVQELSQNGREGDVKLLGLPNNLGGDHLLQSLPPGKGRIVVLGQLGKGPVLSETTWWGTYSPSGALVFYHKNAQGKTESFVVADQALHSNKEYQKAKKGKKTGLGTTYHLKFSMPAFTPQATQSHSFRFYSTPFNGNNKVAGRPSIVLTNYDKLAQQNLKDQKTEVVIRTMLRVLVRTIASHAAKKELQTSDPLLNLVTNLGIDFLSDELEKADTRNCFILPKTIQMSYLQVPAGKHNVQVDILNQKGKLVGTQNFSNISVRSGKTQFVFVTSLQ